MSLIFQTGFRAIRYAEYSDRVLNLNKLEDRMLERNMKLIDKECKTALTFINRDIRQLENEYEMKQELLRYAFWRDKEKQINRTTSILKHNLNDNLAKLHKFDLLKSSSSFDNNEINSGVPQEVVASNIKTQENVKESNNFMLHNRLKKNLSATARLSNVSAQSINDNSEFLTSVRKRRAFSARSSSASFSEKQQNNLRAIVAKEKRPSPVSDYTNEDKQNLEPKNSTSSYAILPIQAPVSVTDKDLFIKTKLVSKDSLESNSSTQSTSSISSNHSSLKLRKHHPAKHLTLEKKKSSGSEFVKETTQNDLSSSFVSLSPVSKSSLKSSSFKISSTQSVSNLNHSRNSTKITRPKSATKHPKKYIQLPHISLDSPFESQEFEF